MVNIGEFIRETAFRPQKPGRDDCALWCGDLVRRATGYDPAADLRGTYDSWFGCRRVVLQAGGMLRLIEPRMDHPALVSTSGDRDGVALIRSGGRILCGILQSGRAVLRREGGGIVLPDDAKIMRSWSWYKL